MPEALDAVLSADGLGWLCLAAFAAGIVRGFAGFGTAMVFLPVAAQFLTPFEALTVLIVKDILAPLYHVPRALRDGNPGDMMRLGAGLLVGMPVGVFLLTLVAPEVFRYGVSIAALLLLSLLISGIRYRGQLTRRLVFGAGALGGVVGGSVGLPGPPVILLYMASLQPAKVVRANNTVFLILADVVLLVLLALIGELVGSAVGLGLFLVLPYLAGNVLGAAIFRPEAETLYRRVAYLIIAVSAISGLPLLD